MASPDYEPWQVEYTSPGWKVLTPDVLAAMAEGADDER